MTIEKKLVSLITFIITTSISSYSWSDEKLDLISEDVYFEVSDASASFGYVIPDSIGPNARFEAEISYNSSEIIDDVENINQAGIMANTYYDFGSNSKVNPYVGLGTGIAHIELENITGLYSNNVDTDILPAYQFMTGLSYKPKYNSDTMFQIGYRYFSVIGDFVPEGASNVRTQYDLDNHSIEGKLKFSF